MTGRVHPSRPLAPIGVSVAVLGLWWLIAHNGGSGWVQALGDVVFGALAIGILGPSLAAARTKVRVVAAPADAAAGYPVEVHVAANRRVRVRPVQPPGPDALAGPTRRNRSGHTEITLLPTKRGVHHTLVVEVASAAPFGLQWWSRRVDLPLPEPLHVAPRRGEPVALPPHARDDPGRSPRHVPSTLGEPRGVRPYHPGDGRRHVHWPATAHVGELMVREMEEPAAQPVVVTVTLPAGEAEAERTAERALGTVLRLHDRGAQVVLTTTEPSGTMTGPVPDRRRAGRRLARAVSENRAPRIEVGR